MTMGMLLSIPLVIFGVGLIVYALRRPRLNALTVSSVGSGVVR
jgi:prolipoprotein diacylglyceryltransferase